MSAAPVSENSLDQEALHTIAYKRGIPDVENEGDCQKDRQGVVIRFFLLLLFLSVAVELHNRGISLEDVLTGSRDGMAALWDPDAPRPAVDGFSILLGVIAVVRNMIPATVMLRLALLFGARFMRAVHDIPSTKEADDYLRTCLFGQVGDGPGLPAALAADWAMEEMMGDVMMRGPFIIVKNGKVDFVTGNKQVGRVGGPGAVVVHNDSAVLLERAGQLTRVVGPGSAPLARFEKVRDVVNLRPRKYATYKDHATFKVGGMSREGIPVVWPVDVYYQINDEGDGYHAPTPGRPYAFSDEAVRQACTDRWLRGTEGQDHLEWGDRIVVSDAEGTLRGIMARLPLDRLIRPLEGESSLPRQQIQQELEDALIKGAAKHGAKILKVDLHDIELQDPVAQQWIETWQARWKKLADEELAEAEAERVYQFEMIKAEAQEMLLAIQEGLEQPGAEEWSISSDIFSLRLIETLQSIAAHPRAMSFAGDLGETFRTWDALRDLIESSVGSIESKDGDQGEEQQP